MTDMGLLAIVATCTFLLLASFIMIFLFIFQSRQAQNRQEKASLQAQYQQELLQTQIEIQNQTLQRIGEELHDNIGQLLSVIKWQLNTVEDNPTHNQVEEVKNTVGKAIQELRALSKSLDGDFVKDFGLTQSLQHELHRIQQTGKCRTHLHVMGEQVSLESQKEMVLFRVAQEILNNALKHANAQNITATLTYASPTFVFAIADDGVGFDPQSLNHGEIQRSGAGLRNIRRRVELLGGSFDLDTQVGQGTKIMLNIPMA